MTANFHFKFILITLKYMWNSKTNNCFISSARSVEIVNGNCEMMGLPNEKKQYPIKNEKNKIGQNTHTTQT